MNIIEEAEEMVLGIDAELEELYAKKESMKDDIYALKSIIDNDDLTKGQLGEMESVFNLTVNHYEEVREKINSLENRKQGLKNSLVMERMKIGDWRRENRPKQENGLVEWLRV